MSAGSATDLETLCTKKPLRAVLLVMIEDRPGHGYDLINRLEPFGFDRSKPAPIYRGLRWLEVRGLIEPGWDMLGMGPARRVYTLSAAGRHVLEISAPPLRRLAGDVDDPDLARYLLARLRTLATTKLAFEFTVEVRLSVQARDEAVARRKLQRTFDKPRVLGTDVRVEAATEPVGSGAGA